MRIKSDPEIQAFIKRCLNNIAVEHKNAFLGQHLTPASEHKVQLQLAKAGFGEFKKGRTWPSLYLSTAEFLASPYHQHIDLRRITDQNFTYTKELIAANELFNSDCIQFDEDRELNDWLKLRALDKSYETIVLWRKERIWMLDAPSERNTIDPCALRARGNVLTFGLGIGYFCYMAARNPRVTAITVIENDPLIITMFKRYLLPQFPHLELNIITGNAYDYFNQAYLSAFDYVFVDIWQSNHDGLLAMEHLLERYNPPFQQVDFWIENSCLEIMPALIFAALCREFCPDQYAAYARRYPRLMHKTMTGLKQDDTILQTVEQIKDRMYDKTLMRHILSIKKTDHC